ncbi:MAG: protein kinase, partial [Candidatus Riflebacteria bacterium]|nr:protein kinase [Candidatus Riflebacteria bacterium]
IVSELVEGRSLHDLLGQRASLSVPETLHIARRVLSGLEAIHRLGIVHRDLKPANIVVGPGEPPIVKILDFGIAKRTVGVPVGDQAPKTSTGVVMGTPEYMAPEQAAGDPPSPATDLYAFTLVLYRMIVGSPVFTASSTLELIHKHLKEEPSIPLDLIGSVRELLARGLKKLPGERFATATECLAVLDGVAAEVNRSGSFRQIAAGSAPTAARQPVAVPVNAGAARTDGAPADRSVHAAATAPAVSCCGPTEPCCSAGPGPGQQPRSGAGPMIGAVVAIVVLGVVVLGRAHSTQGPERPGPTARGSVAARPAVETAAGDAWNRSWEAPPLLELDDDSLPDRRSKTGGMGQDDEPLKVHSSDSYGTRAKKLGEETIVLELAPTPTQSHHRWGYDGFQPAGGALLAPGSASPARLWTDMIGLKDTGTAELSYRLSDPMRCVGGSRRLEGYLDLQLESAPAALEAPGLVYRVRLDFARPGFLVLVTDPDGCSSQRLDVERTRFSRADEAYRLFQWRPGRWRLMARFDCPSMKPSGRVRLQLDKALLTVTVGSGPPLSLALRPPYRLPRTTTLHLGVVTGPRTCLLLDRVALEGTVVRDF